MAHDPARHVQAAGRLNLVFPRRRIHFPLQLCLMRRCLRAALSLLASAVLVVHINLCFGDGPPSRTNPSLAPGNLAVIRPTEGWGSSGERDFHTTPSDAQHGHSSKKTVGNSAVSRRLLDTEMNVVNVWETSFRGAANHQTRLSMNTVLVEAAGHQEYVGVVPAGTTPDAEALFWGGTRNRIVLSCSNNTALYIDASDVVFRSFQIQGCSRTQAAAIVVATAAKNVVFEDCVFVENNQGGALEAAADSQVFLRNVLIANNTLQSDIWRGAAITTAGELRLDSCAIQDNLLLNINKRLLPGSLAVLPGGRLVARNTTFKGNFGRTGGAVSVGSASGGADADIQNCTFSGNSCAEGGCGLHLQAGSTAVVVDTNFMDQFAVNFTGTQGGGVWIDAESKLQLHNCTFHNNNVTLGAGIMVENGSFLNVSSCTFTGNIADPTVVYYGAGAGICVNNNTRVYVHDCLFDGNGPANVGAGIAMSKFDGKDSSSLLQMTNSVFRNNTCSRGGCALFVEADRDGYAINVDVRHTVFEGNRALSTDSLSGVGGAVYIRLYSTAVFNSCEFLNNSGIRGGAISAKQYAHSNITNCNFFDNHAAFGGALNIEDDVVMVINSSVLAWNSADNTGGAIDLELTARLVMYNGTIKGNTASGQGGGIYLTGNTILAMEHMVMQGNSARHGGAISQATTFGSLTSNLTMANCELTDNAASQHGGALFLGAATNMSRCILTNNRANATGGAISVQDTGQFIITGSRLRSNRATEGGSLYMTGLVAIHDTDLSDDRADRGGSMYVHSGNLTMEHSSFNGCSARYSGGAIQVDSAGWAELKLCSLANCSALEGGAMAIYGQVFLSAIGRSAALLQNNTSSRAGCVLADNSAQRGGALFVAGDGYMNVADCNISGCQATERGGAVMSLERSTISIAGSMITGNGATMQGGGLHIAGPALLWDTSVAENTAGMAGGGLAFDNAGSQLKSAFRVADPNIETSGDQEDAVIQGAKLSKCIIAHNRAGADGGGVYVSGTVEIISTWLRNNTANRNGGGMACEGGPTDDATASMRSAPATGYSCSMNASTFTGNEAVNGSGGAVYLMGKATLQTLHLRSNSAGHDGGGIMCDSCSQLDAVGLVVDGNHARGKGGALSLVPLRDVMLDSLNLTGNTAGWGGGAHLNSLRCEQGILDDAHSCINVTNATVLSNRALGTLTDRALETEADAPMDNVEGLGGGLYIEAFGNIWLQDLQLHGNEAFSGAGVYINNTACNLGASEIIRRCLRLEQFVAEDNQERPARGMDSRSIYGPNMFVTKPEAVGVACTGVTGAERRLDLLSFLGTARALDGCLTDQLRLDPKGVASGVHSLGIYPAPVKDRPLVVSSRDNLNVQLLPLDMFGQPTQLPTTEKAEFEASIIAGPPLASAQLLGPLLVQGKLSAPVNFSGLQLLADPGIYTLEFTARQAYLDLSSVKLQLRVRECQAGELVGKHECENCGERGQYSLMPASLSCLSCEVYGNCARGVLIPKPGYWQSHPRSPQLHACLYTGACTYTNRDTKLLEFQDLHRPIESNLISPDKVASYRQLQCTNGYAGTLCAACTHGYGRNGPFCVPCRFKSSAISVALTAIILAQALVIIGQITIFNLSVQRQAGNSLNDQHPEELIGRNASNPEVDHTKEVSFREIDCNNHQGCKDVSIDIGTISRPVITGCPSSTPVCSHSGTRSSRPDGITQAGKVRSTQHQTGSSSLMTAGNDGGEILQSDIERGLAEQATGAVKILVEYVQILGIIGSVKLPMPVMVRNFLNTLDITSASSSQMLYCSLWGSPPTRVVASVVFSVLLPLAFVAASPILVGLSHISVQQLTRWRPLGGHNRHDTCHHIVAGIIFVLLFFFPNVCRQLLIIFSVVQLDDPNLATPPGTKLSSQGWYWQNLPDIEYFHGTHKLMVLILGIPGLLLYAVAFPVTLAALLYCRRHCLKETSVRIQYGMLYSDYREERYYWQSVVLAVQLMLIMCAVLLSSVGTSVQLLSALVIIIIYQFLTVLALPFNDQRLMLLARIMLLAVMLTLVLMLYLNVVITDRSRTALIVLLLVLNTAITALLLGYIVYVLARSQNTRTVIKYLKRAVTVQKIGSRALQSMRSLTNTAVVTIPTRTPGQQPGFIYTDNDVTDDVQDDTTLLNTRRTVKGVEMGKIDSKDSAAGDPTLCIIAIDSFRKSYIPDLTPEMASMPHSSKARDLPASATLLSLSDATAPGPNKDMLTSVNRPAVPRSGRLKRT